jgi:hypothetical protein
VLALITILTVHTSSFTADSCDLELIKAAYILFHNFAMMFFDFVDKIIKGQLMVCMPIQNIQNIHFPIKTLIFLIFPLKLKDLSNFPFQQSKRNIVIMLLLKLIKKYKGQHVFAK